MAIFDLIKELRSDNSRLFKEAILARESNNLLLKRVFRMSLDPLLQFNIKKIPLYEHDPNNVISLDTGLDMMADLTNRKYTGNAGIEHLRKILSSCAPEDAEIIKLVIAKDPDCGISVTTLNKIWPATIKETPYMRCSLLRDLLKKKPAEDQIYISQVKADGMFVNVNVHEDLAIDIYSRNGRYFEPVRFGELFEEIKLMKPGFQYHGELLVQENGKILPREIGNGVLNSVLKGGRFGEFQEPVLYLWDMIPISAAVPDGKYEVPYSERFLQVRMQTMHEDTTPLNFIRIIETEFVTGLKEAFQHYFECTEAGLEGTIIKFPHAIWEDRTSDEQFKVKVEFDCDLKIVGFNPGNGKNEKTFGSLKCESADGLLTVNISGLKDAQRQEIWNNREEYIDKIVAVKSNNVLEKNGTASLFLPRFVEIREDKDEADTLQRIKDQLESALAII